MRSTSPSPPPAGVAAVRAAARAVSISLLAAACAPLGVRELRMPPVAESGPSDSALFAGRAFRRVDAPAFELYAQSTYALALAEGRLRRATHEFARHFGGAPKVVVLLFDPPADPAREFDFGPFVERGAQVLAFVRAPDARHGPLGIDESLFDARAAELLLASYADSVVAARGGRRRDAHASRALDRLPHWFAEAVVSRVASPDVVEQGRRYSHQNRVRLLPLRRLFGLRRTGGATWSELASRVPVAPVAEDARQERQTVAPHALLAAESTAFGEFVVDRLGPTALQALADELLVGRTTEQALGEVAGMEIAGGLEREWAEWLGR